MLQAIAAWDLALTYWKQRHDYHRHRGFYAKVPVARQAFTAVPLRAFDLLWNDRKYFGSIEIEVRHSKGWIVTMELMADSTEQVYVRPKPDVDPNTVRQVATQYGIRSAHDGTRYRRARLSTTESRSTVGPGKTRRGDPEFAGRGPSNFGLGLPP